MKIAKFSSVQTPVQELIYWLGFGCDLLVTMETMKGTTSDTI